MSKKNKKKAESSTIALNRKAYHDYEVLDELEAGIVLTGSEVKSLRQGKASIKEAYAAEKNGEIYLINSHISEYPPAKNFGHEPRRHRKLLLHQKEINRLIGLIDKQGITLIPLALYFNSRGLAKCKIAVGKGKKVYDKRRDIKKRDWERQKRRIMK